MIQDGFFVPEGLEKYQIVVLLKIQVCIVKNSTDDDMLSRSGLHSQKFDYI